MSHHLQPLAYDTLRIVIGNVAVRHVQKRTSKSKDDINSNKYEGKFKDIIVSFLNTIESFKSPLKETLIILQNLAEGNLTQMMNGDYRGDFDKLKDTTNATINSLMI